MNESKNFGEINNEGWKDRGIEGWQSLDGHSEAASIEAEESLAKSRPAFTLAEVLITLVVIGVIAAITVPVLISDANEKTWSAGREKALNSLGEAFKLMTIDGPAAEYENGAEDLVEKLLPQYIKIAKVCKGENAPSDCGFSEYIKKPNGDKVGSSTLKSRTRWVLYSGNGALGWQTKPESYGKVGFIQTADGFSAAVHYSPDCRADEIDNAATKNYAEDAEKYGFTSDAIASAICFNAVYDMNGKKGPNQVGKDIGFVGSFYYGVSTRTAAVLPAAHTGGGVTAGLKKCKAFNKNYTIPTIDELSLSHFNNNLVGSGGCWYLSTSPVPGTNNNRMAMPGQQRSWTNKYNNQCELCVRM